MKLKPEEKTGDMIRELQAINDSCFTGTERVPAGMFEYFVNENDVFIVRRNGCDVAGFAIVDDYLGDKRIWTIAVRPEARGLGYGKELLAEIDDEYFFRQSVVLTVRVDNVDAIVLYLKNGYMVQKVLQNYYLGGVDGIFMRRKHDN